jgi:hypothetical protein
VGSNPTFEYTPSWMRSFSNTSMLRVTNACWKKILRVYRRRRTQQNGVKVVEYASSFVVKDVAYRQPPSSPWSSSLVLSNSHDESSCHCHPGASVISDRDTKLRDPSLVEYRRRQSVGSSAVSENWSPRWRWFSKISIS